MCCEVSSYLRSLRATVENRRVCGKDEDEKGAVCVTGRAGEATGVTTVVGIVGDTGVIDVDGGVRCNLLSWSCIARVCCI